MVALSACGDGAAPSTKPAASIDVSTGAGQSAEVGEELAVAPAVIVRDSAGQPVSGALVTFSVRRGSIERTSARTSRNGIASPGRWRLPESSGLDTLVAIVAGVSPRLLTAVVRAGAPVGIVVANPTGFESRVFDNLDLPVFKVIDRFGNGVSGIAMTLRVVGTDGTMPTSRAAAEADVTDAFGIVGAAAWIPYTVGDHRLEASANGGAFTTIATRHVREDACGARHVIGMGMTRSFDLDATTKVAGCGDTLDLVTVILSTPAVITVDAGPRAASPADAADVRSAWLTRAPGWTTPPQQVRAPSAAAARVTFSQTVSPGGTFDVRIAMPRAVAARGSTVTVTVAPAAAAVVAQLR